MQVKHGSSGYATFNYSEAGFKEADLVKVDVVVNGDNCDPLSFIAHSDKATEQGRKTVEKLKVFCHEKSLFVCFKLSCFTSQEVISRQQFEIVLQAKVNSKVLARARIAPFRFS